MSIKSVVFDIPDQIAKGLESGVYERIGGTIRDSSNGQIVAFLRETSSGLSQALPSLAQIGSVASILNCGVSLAGFGFVLAKLNQLESKMDRILEEIQEVNFKIDLGFRSKFTTAVKQLSRALVVKDKNLKASLLANITQAFSESHEIFKGGSAQYVMMKEQNVTLFNFHAHLPNLCINPHRQEWTNSQRQTTVQVP